MTKNNGQASVTQAEIRHLDNSMETIYSVIINHFDDPVEIWEQYSTEQEAREEAFLWNNGLWGEGFTYSAEWLRLNTKDDKVN